MLQEKDFQGGKNEMLYRSNAVNQAYIVHPGNFIPRYDDGKMFQWTYIHEVCQNRTSDCLSREVGITPEKANFKSCKKSESDSGGDCSAFVSFHNPI